MDEYVEWTEETRTNTNYDLYGEGRVLLDNDQDGLEYWSWLSWVGYYSLT